MLRFHRLPDISGENLESTILKRVAKMWLFSCSTFTLGFEVYHSIFLVLVTRFQLVWTYFQFNSVELNNLTSLHLIEEWSIPVLQTLLGACSSSLIPHLILNLTRPWAVSVTSCRLRKRFWTNYSTKDKTNRVQLTNLKSFHCNRWAIVKSLKHFGEFT